MLPTILHRHAFPITFSILAVVQRSLPDLDEFTSSSAVLAADLAPVVTKREWYGKISFKAVALVYGRRPGAPRTTTSAARSHQ